MLDDVNRALAPHGQTLGHDPWTVGVATVGGTISTDSLGYLGGAYGSMGDQVLGLEVVMPDGSVTTLGGGLPEMGGLDLRGVPAQDRGDDLGDRPAVAIIKHANPCGAATADDLAELKG